MEETGLICRWIVALKRLLDYRRSRNWARGAADPVNVSPIQLRQRDFVETLKQRSSTGTSRRHRPGDTEA